MAAVKKAEIERTMAEIEAQSAVLLEQEEKRGERKQWPSLERNVRNRADRVFTSGARDNHDTSQSECDS